MILVGKQTIRFGEGACDFRFYLDEIGKFHYDCKQIDDVSFSVKHEIGDKEDLDELFMDCDVSIRLEYLPSDN